jgi:hypothetical protein
MGEPHAQQGQQAWTRSLRIANVQQKETREIERMPIRGEDDPRKTHGNSGWGGGTLEQELCWHLKSFYRQEFYLNLLRCMYSHCICLLETGIMLFVNQRGYVHSEPPIVICTVVIVVNIAARQQHF